jgi:IS1 family transposase
VVWEEFMLMNPKCHKCGTAAHCHGVQDNGKKRYYCNNKECPVITFNEDYGTGYYNMKLDKKDVDEVIYLFFHGFPVSEMPNLKGVTEQCIRDTLSKAIIHFERFEEFKINYDGYIPEIIEIDEIYLNVQGSKEFYGWIAYDPKNKFIIHAELGKRDEETLRNLFSRLKKYRGKTKLVLVDGLKSYKHLIMKYLGKNGHPPKVGVLNKSKYMKEQQGFLTYGLFGVGRTGIEELIQKYGIGNKISTALIECLNKLIRDNSPYLKRRSARKGRGLRWILKSLKGIRFFRNFCKPHWALSFRSSKNWLKIKITPLMEIDIADHILSIREILSCKIPH